ncbi:hypothetical protein [Paenibacillus sp. LjRoot56]|uniref:hypothetical protein n=1 Tax=Paenibacillus sp. LjRoot56 TaxID=3342333 RepID=UPI003ECF488E
MAVLQAMAHTHRHEEMIPMPVKRKRNERPKLRIVADYMVIDGELKQIDPLKTDLPDRCMKVIAEVMTGCKCEMVDRR